MTLRFGTDGLRGVANRELTAELALALGRAAARRMGAGTFLVGRDTRRSGSLLAASLAAGLASEGARVVDVGVVPTPGLAWLAADRRVPGAMVSASHNPFHDNGIKLLSSSGTKLAEPLEHDIEEELRRLVAGGAPPDLDGVAVGEVLLEPDARDAYVAHLVGAVRLDEPARLKVVCDCANGAAAPLAAAVLAGVGVDAVLVAAEPDGVNINDRCGSTHAERLGPVVREHGADLGLCFDGDADRLIALDHLGRVVDGDQLLALFALDLHARGELRNDAVAVTVMSNLGLRRALEGADIAVVETPVGDRYVVDAMVTHDLVLGGEQSGHLVFRREATTGDGLLTGVKLLELVHRRARPLAELAAAAMRRLPQELATVRVPEPRRLEGAAVVWAEVDAVQAALEGRGRVLLRPSGTEPVVRVMVEAETAEEARSCTTRLVKVVQAALGSSSAG